MATITVDPNTSFQTFLGWECIAQTGLGDYPVSGLAYHDAALDAAVATGINRVRTEIISGMAENTTDYWQNYINSGFDWTTDGGTTENPAYRAYLNNAYIPVNDDADPNTITSSGFQWGLFNWSVDKFITPMRSKLAARGETLYWTHCYVHFSLSNQLHIDTPAEYGELILATWQHSQSTYGIVPDALEIFLEPDNTNASVTAAEQAAMIQAARDRLVNAGFAKPHIIAPSTLNAANATVWYNGIKSANPTAAGYIDTISYHRYDVPATATIDGIQSLAATEGKQTAMTEWTPATSISAHEDLKNGRVSAHQQYTISYPGSNPAGDGIIFNVGSSPGYALTKVNRWIYLQHYSKYIRRGAVRKSASTDNSNFDGIPFRNTNGKYVVPIQCAASGTVNVAGLPAGTYGIKYSTGDRSSGTPTAAETALSNQTITAGQSVSFAMPAAGVATVYDVDYLTQQATHPGRGSRMLFLR